MSTCFLVLGTPRSGTSCVAGILHHLGIPMGDRLLHADEWNPAGYFQDLDFDKLIIPALRCEWPGWDAKRTLPSVRELAALRSQSHEVWGLKSNRIAHFLPDLIAGAGEVRVILTSRPKAVSIASFKARSGETEEGAAGIIDRMTDVISQALQACKLSPILTVDYQDLLSDPESWVDQIAAVVGVHATSEAVKWIQPELQRFRNG